MQSYVMEKKVCVNCVMDTTDVTIEFDDEGVCNYCQNFKLNILPSWNFGVGHEKKIARLIELIKRDGVDNEFDCIIGLSGGLDSSYTSYVAKEIMGLRPLLVHVDSGWNTEQAVYNIEKLVDGLDVELYTDVVNWQGVKNTQIAFLKSGIPDQDLVQDAAFFSGLYKFARKYKIKHVLTGSNYSTECCREPEAWGGYLGIDKLLFKDIQRKFYGNISDEDFPIIDILTYKLWYRFAKGIRVHYPLNIVPYVKTDAEKILADKFGWKSFQHKHHESRFTRFYEDHWLPKRFGFDKRKAHFSSLIMTGQMERSDALNRLAKSELDEFTLEKEFEYVAHKLELDITELRELFNLKINTYNNYSNKRWLIKIGAKVLSLMNKEKRFIQ